MSPMDAQDGAEGRAAEEPLPQPVLDEIRRTRRHPRPAQPDYLHLRYLVTHVRQTLETVHGPIRDVLDVYCGTGPYDDLLPPGAVVRGLDVNSRYGTPDIVASELLPCEDGSFDLVVCYEAFQYVPDPVAAVAEFARVLRPGGTALVTVPLVWEYDRETLERRFTGPELAELFEEWEEVMVVENGGPGVTWATVTGQLLHRLETGVVRRHGAGALMRSLTVPLYLAMNAAAMQIERADRRWGDSPRALPMNLLVRARKPAGEP